ncbi:inorganic phosphate transporter family protein [Arabidopsis thaliana]|uniref:Inorganic phosphate transporter family protein n=1 Tax=Arabidopsis thaliana TaxID=3702 RepID=F4JJ78_ARATH|nr:inorganic phosphate transporter family protein [Arabidopsis thaliana]AEE82693.1 inorganic phosphate transporter family protein [Arabidopsis thaliana]|eukprot:NP_680669.1 inorganic phosphate transporter family protein [Arabidopsis thaliana]
MTKLGFPKTRLACSPRNSFVVTDSFTTFGWLPSAKTMNALQELFMIVRAQTIIACCSTVPAVPYHHWTLPANRIGFVIFYSFTFFFSNFGPNATTFIVPAEIFPARIRSTCHGISAASGKAGAMVGSFGFAALGISLEELTGETKPERVKEKIGV